MSKVIIAPSILASDWGKLSAEIQSVEEAGADWIHLDVMDGHFVPPITFGPQVVDIARKATNLPIDVHLMINAPDKQIKQFADAGATSISVHVEACSHLHRTIQMIQQLSCKVGVALNPATSLSSVEEVLTEIDILLLMTVNPGWGGQKFIDSSVDKIKRAHAIIQQLKTPTFIEVDGGINQTTAQLAQSAGASILVAGTAIFAEKNYKTAISALR